MIQRFLILLLSIALSGLIYSQEIDFFIVDRNGDEMNDTVYIIESMTLNLSTNFEQLGIEYVFFEDNDSYGNEEKAFPIGFDFKFYDENKDSFYIAPTGFLNLEGPNRPLRYPNEVIPFPGAPSLKNSIYGCFMAWEPVSDKSEVFIGRDTTVCVT